MKLYYSTITKSFSTQFNLSTIIPKLKQKGWVKADTDWEQYDLRSAKLKCDISLVNKTRLKRAVSRGGGGFMPTSRADRWDCYIKILGFNVTDYFGNDIKNKLDPRYENNKELFDELADMGMVEATNCNTPQWGTWKFWIRDNRDMDEVVQAINEYIK